MGRGAVAKSMAEARREFTRDEILSTAERLFTEQGVRSTSIGQVAEAVGMTRANLYYYFPSKDILLRETLLVCLQRYRDNWSTIPEDADPREIARHVVTDRFAEIARQGPTDLRFFYVLLTDQAGKEEAGRIREEIEAVSAMIRGALERGRRRGEVGERVDVRDASYSLIMEVMGLDMLWLTNPDAVDLLARAGRIAARFVDEVRARH